MNTAKFLNSKLHLLVRNPHNKTYSNFSKTIRKLPCIQRRAVLQWVFIACEIVLRVLLVVLVQLAKDGAGDHLLGNVDVDLVMVILGLVVNVNLVGVFALFLLVLLATVWQ